MRPSDLSWIFPSFSTFIPSLCFFLAFRSPAYTEVFLFVTAALGQLQIGGVVFSVLMDMLQLLMLFCEHFTFVILIDLGRLNIFLLFTSAVYNIDNLYLYSILSERFLFFLYHLRPCLHFNILAHDSAFFGFSAEPGISLNCCNKRTYEQVFNLNSFINTYLGNFLVGDTFWLLFRLSARYYSNDFTIFRIAS